VKEAHQYFKKAYDILESKTELSGAEKTILIDLLNSWGYVYYYLGEINEFIDIYSAHQTLADSLDDEAKTGMFYAWFGIALFMAGKSKNAYDYLQKGLELGEKVKDEKVVGYACTWLTWACGEMGLFAEGLDYGERAQNIAKDFPSDQYLFFKSLGAICMINYYQGNTNKVFEDAERLVEHGDRNANSRSKVFGLLYKAFGHMAAGDMKSSQKSSQKAIEIASEPFYVQLSKMILGISYFFNGQLQEAEEAIGSGLDVAEKLGLGSVSVMLQYYLAPVLIANGQMKQGTELLEKARKLLSKNQRRVHYAISEYVIGEVNSQIASGPKPSLATMAKNIGFLVKNVPTANKKADKHFNQAIELLKEIGMRGILGQVYLSQGLLYKASKRSDRARQCILEAIDLFKECAADGWLKQANEAFDSLE
jgi:tetratricopeptide (TPR) repeat protein